MISVVIIAKDEEKKIGDCLKSVEWADEVIIIDDNSTDKTARIAKKEKVKVFIAPAGITSKYQKLRNFGLKKAKGNWILYVDADERVEANLREEIIRLVNKPIGQSTFSCYAVPRKNIIFGKELKHGGFGGFDYVKRLFIKKRLKRWVGDLHEEPEFLHKGEITRGKEGEVGHLKGKFVHYKAQTLSEMVEKTNKWSQIEAGLMFQANHPQMNTLRFLSAMFREFWFRFVIKRAFMDGSVGIIHGLYQVYSRFISYAKLWEMQLEANNSKLRTKN